MKNKTRYANIGSDILTNKGGTYSLFSNDRVTFDEGYNVGVGYEGKGTLVTISVTEFKKFCRNKLAMRKVISDIIDAYLKMPEYSFIRKGLKARDSHFDSFLGAWIDNGVVYLEMSYYIPSRSIAVELAVLLNQEAIYNWGTKECESVLSIKHEVSHYG